ncbi:transcription factor S [Candidatus Bathyarchaeota archaeon]|nr:MAG: transcription factor S [Candidatus Bathyarchaeota archaeon]
MEFCPKCGARLILSVKKKGTSKFSLKCPNCGYEVKSKKPSPAIVKRIEKPSVEPIVVIGEKEAKIKTLPTEKVECPNCGNMEAYVWIVQTRGADESSTQFFRCTKCGTTWREYS